MLGMGRFIPGKGHIHDEELRQLQRKNQRLKETVEILEPIYERMISKKQWVSWTCRSDRASEGHEPSPVRY
jgi:hypothetical protein